MTAYSAAKFVKSAHEPGQFVPDEGIEVAFAGRSNAGKSSAINAITGRKALARTSKSPGRTQLVNFFALPSGRRLVDLPGYGFARVPDVLRAHWAGLMDAYFGSRRSLRGLVIAVDARRGIGEHDLQMLEWMAEPPRATLILLTRADKLKRGAAAVALRKATGETAGRAEVRLFSAVRGDGVQAARAWLEAVWAG